MNQDEFRAVVDVGTTKVTAMLAQRRPDREVELVGVGVQPCSAMSRGTITDPREITESARAAIKEASDTVGQTDNARVLGLGRQQYRVIESVPRRARAGAPSGRLPKKTCDSPSIRPARSNFPPGMKMIHVIPRGYSLDGLHGVRNPLGMHASEVNIQSHCLIGDTRHVEALSNAVTSAGITPSEFIVTTVAAGASVLTYEEREEGVVLVDIGGGTTDIVVYAEGSIIHTTSLPVGGHQITNDLSIAFDVEIKEAGEREGGMGIRHPGVGRSCGRDNHSPQDRRRADQRNPARGRPDRQGTGIGNLHPGEDQAGTRGPGRSFAVQHCVHRRWIEHRRARPAGEGRIPAARRELPAPRGVAGSDGTVHGPGIRLVSRRCAMGFPKPGPRVPRRPSAAAGGKPAAGRTSHIQHIQQIG